jgi:uncharacterized protein (DUF427 family)
MTTEAPPRLVKIPGPQHMITVENHPGRVVVKLGEAVIADSRDAVVLFEDKHEPVYYIPRKDADMAQFVRTEHVSYCAYKGEANYFSLPLGGERSVNAVWTYETPFEAVAPIKEHLAFYPERVDAIEAAAD